MTVRPSQEPNVIIRPLDLERDAEALARMWNESDLAWPGSWTDGVPVTAEAIREEEESQRMLVIYVAEVDGEIAGYCSFEHGEHGERLGEGYLDLLNVNPKFHGQSIGRRLIQATIQRAVEEGWKRQTLGTWSANCKAVPAYKKTGHFWTPDTSVWMQNFIPGALQMPLAEPFFARHDWYRCYVRAITQEWDEERWEGLKVFTEHWEADGESLTIRIDREARAPVAVETDAVAVAAIAADIEPLCGAKTTVTWRVTNKGSEPLGVYLHALGDKGLTIDHRDAWVVAPGETAERTAEVEVAEDAPAKKEEDETVPAVRSILRLGETEVELFSGMRPRKPLRLDTAPGSISVRPGVAETIRLQLHSEMAEPTAVVVRLTPPEGLAVDWTLREVEVGAKGFAALPVQVTAGAEGVYRLPVRVERPGAKAVAEEITLFSLDAGGILVHREGESVRVETDAVRMNVSAKGGAVKVEHKARRGNILSLLSNLGPPFFPFEFGQKTFAVDVAERGGRVVVTLSAEAEHYPGLVLHEEVALSPSGVGTMAMHLENRGAEPFDKRIDLRIGTANREACTTVLPLKQGIVRTPTMQYPAAHEDAPRQPDAYAEPWAAWEWRGTVAGVSWGAEMEKVSPYGWRQNLQTAPLEVAPGARSEVTRLRFYAGTGDWKDARRAFGLAGADRPALAVRRPVTAWVEPAVIAGVGDSAEGRLVVDSVSRRVDDVAVTVSLDGGATASVEALRVERLTRGAGETRDLRIALPAGGAGCYTGLVTLESALWRETTPFQVLRLGTGGTVRTERVEREGQEIWRVDNGRATVEVAPGFGPSVIAWTVDGVNMLQSSFPTPAGMSWMYPHFGGVYPQLLPAGSSVWEGYLYREEIAAEPLAPRAGDGLGWAGVRLSAVPKMKRLQGLRAEIDVLTLGGSPVLQIVYRLCNLRPVEHACRQGLSIVPSLGVGPRELTAIGEGIHRRPTPWAGWVMGQHWAGVTHEATGRTMLLIGKRPNVAAQDYGQHGRLLGFEDDARLAGDEVQEQTFYLVVANSVEEALGYRGLSNL